MSKISLVVVDAVSPDIEENRAVALPNIQTLVDSGLTTRVYECCVGESPLKHKGKRMQRGYRDRVELGDVLDEIVPGEVILAGGSLGNYHYCAFVALLEAIRAQQQESGVHIPFDCTYSFENKYGSGESWEDGKLGDVTMSVSQMYRQAMQKYGLAARIIEPGQGIGSEQQLITVRLWDEWKQMATYFQDLP